MSYFYIRNILTFFITKYNQLPCILSLLFSYTIKKFQEELIMKWIDNTLLTLAIIGCVNWGLIGFFRFDLVSFIFGDMTWISRIIYALVGLSGVYMLTFYGRIRSNMID